MKRLDTPAALRETLAGRPCALVPTMGNLHAGHLALVQAARRHGLPVVTSLFVNPLQFGAGEDYARYPRTLDADCEKLAAAGCDYVFAPAVEAMYPEPQTFLVAVPDALASDLCGAHRPGHFAGVATVVLKLFSLVAPRVAIFGRKDWQQLIVIRRMVAQFNLPILIEAVETVREPDGLAMSSRNQYLSAAERAAAPALYTELTRVARAIESGDGGFEALAEAARHRLTLAGWRVDYFTVRELDTLAVPGENSRDLVVLAAARLGETRLIDNLSCRLGAAG